MVLFGFQIYSVCNFGKFINFGLGTVKSERVTRWKNAVKMQHKRFEYRISFATMTLKVFRMVKFLLGTLNTNYQEEIDNLRSHRVGIQKFTFLVNSRRQLSIFFVVVLIYYYCCCYYYCYYYYYYYYCVAYTTCVATLWRDRIYLFAHESRAPVTWSSVVRRTSKLHMYALRTYLLLLYSCRRKRLPCQQNWKHFTSGINNMRKKAKAPGATFTAQANAAINAPTRVRKPL